MYKTFKFRLYPTTSQKESINKNFYATRYTYNYYLNSIETNGFKSASTYIKDYQTRLKYEMPLFKEVEPQLIIKSIYNLENSLKRYYQNLSSFPKYKSKFYKNSYTINNTYLKYQSTIKLDLKKQCIILPTLNEIKIKGYKKIKIIPGKILNATISQEPTGKYYISVLYQQIDNTKYNSKESIIGIDLGIKKLLTLSDGITYDNNKYIQKYEKRIKRCQKELSRKIKGSKNYYKCKIKLANLYSKLKNSRKYYIHKITKQITDTYDIIVCEKLQTKEMITKGKLSKKIIDASFQEIIRQLEYKSRWKNKLFYQIDTYYPSSQTCSICGNIDKKYKNLNEREYNCIKCHNKMDRDYNASVNIMFEGLKLFINKNYC